MRYIYRLTKMQVLHIRPVEYKWIKNILNLSKKNSSFRNNIRKLKINSYTNRRLASCLEINKDGHTMGTMNWSLRLVSHVLNTRTMLKKCDCGTGLSYPNSWLS